MKKVFHLVIIGLMLAIFSFGITQIFSVFHGSYWFERELLEASILLIFAIVAIVYNVICISFGNADRFSAYVEVIREERETKKKKRDLKKTEQLRRQLSALEAKTEGEAEKEND